MFQKAGSRPPFRKLSQVIVKRASRGLLFSLIAAVGAGVGLAQTTSTATQDPQAVAILGKYLQVSGGTGALESIQDYTESGDVAFNWAGKQVQGTVTIKGKGLADFRMDSTLPNGTQSWVINHLSGVLVTIDGKPHDLAPYNLINVGDLTIPAIRIAAAANDPSTGISYLGEHTVNGHETYEVQLTPAANPAFAPIQGLAGAGAIDLFVDATNFELIEETETLHGRRNVPQTYEQEIDFADYQPEDGVLVPLSVSEIFAGQPTWKVTVSSVAFNVGLSDSDFTIPQQ
ncbi:MAG TPA: hypothetical protein VNJ52_00120 [Patescibacteria group bacterium]|nr:hypothetical protein [Patescibacteria group bacterium]